MNPNLIRVAIIAAASVGGGLLGFGTYKGVRALHRRSKAKKAARVTMPTKVSPMPEADVARQAA